MAGVTLPQRAAGQILDGMDGGGMDTGDIVTAVIGALAVLVTITTFLISRRGYHVREQRAEEQAELARQADRRAIAAEERAKAAEERAKAAEERAKAADKRAREAAQPRLSAEWLDGPTPAPYGNGFDFCYRVRNRGTRPAEDPRGEIIDAQTGELVEPNGASFMGTDGVLDPDEAAEATITIPSLERPMKLRLLWYVYEDDEPKDHTHISKAPVPQSEEEAAALRRRYRGADGPDAEREPSPS